MFESSLLHGQIALAKKAKAEGVKQFIFLSSASVYGDGAQIGKDKMINKDTPVAPATWPKYTRISIVNNQSH